MKGPTFADFFAGIGLARLGLEGAGWQCAFANDIDPKKHEMYEAHFGAADEYVLGDVRSLIPRHVPDAALWWASFPCTDLSLAGYRKGLAGQQSGSLLAFLQLLEEKDGQRPAIVALENVTGFLTSRRGTDFAATIRALNRLGYTCDAFALDAIHFVPQSRSRLFIIGVFDAPSMTRGDAEAALKRRDERLKRRQLSEFIAAHHALNWMIRDMPVPPRRETWLADAVEQLPEESPRWWTEDRVAYLLDQMFPRHLRVVQTLRNGSKTQYATAYRRIRAGRSMAEVRADGIAGCLRTPRGGSSRQILLVLGKGRVRVRFMTPRECAGLMGAADYAIDVSDNQAYFGFGDAVCVPVVRWIAQSFFNPVVDELGVFDDDAVPARLP